MDLAWKACAGLAALLHTLFFLGESVLFTRPEVAARFLEETHGVELASAVALLRVPMLNQGFYNLFLAAGVAVGIALAARSPTVARTLVTYVCLTMVGAGIVLVCSEPRLIAGACVQALPPALALVFLWRTSAGAEEGAEPRSS